MSGRNDVFWQLLTEALYTDGVHHKQWYLEQIAEWMCGDEDWPAWKKMTQADDGEWEPGIAP